MNIDRLCGLVEQAVNAGSTVSSVDEDGVQVSIQAVEMRVDGHTIASMIHSSQFGLFHLQAGGGTAPFVSLGQLVEPGQRIGLIEAMKVFSPVLADRACRIVAVLAEHGAEVECGQPLFHVE